MILTYNARRFFLYSMMTMMASLAFSKALVEISFVFAMFFYLQLLLQDYKKFHVFAFPRTALFFLIAFVAFVSFSLTWSEYPKESFRGLFKILQAATIFLMAVEIFHTEQENKNFGTFFIGLFLVMIVNALVQYGFGHDLIRGNEYLYSSAGRRITSAFKAYGLFANFLNVACLYVYIKLISQKKMDREKLLYLLLFILGVYCLFLTRSRGAWIAFTLSLFSVTLLKKKWFILIFLLGVGAVGVSQIPTHMLIHLDSNRQEQSIVERFDLWQRAIKVITAKPLTGTGINTYAKAHQKYDTGQSKRVLGYYVHNGYLQMAAEIGIPGLFLFLGFVISCLFIAILFSVRQKIHDSEVSAWVGGNLAFLALSFVDTVMHNATSFFLFVFTLGLMMSAYCRFKKGIIQ